MPTFHTPITNWQKKVEEVNDSQKADLQFQEVGALKKAVQRIESLEKQILLLRERIEYLESEDGVGGTPYSDGPVR